MPWFWKAWTVGFEYHPVKVILSCLGSPLFIRLSGITSFESPDLAHWLGELGSCRQKGTVRSSLSLPSLPRSNGGRTHLDKITLLWPRSPSSHMQGPRGSFCNKPGRHPFQCIFNPPPIDTDRLLTTRALFLYSIVFTFLDKTKRPLAVPTPSGSLSEASSSAVEGAKSTL